MVTIESTPEMAANVYETLERNLTIVRRRLGRPLAMVDKVLLGHLDDPGNQEIEPGDNKCGQARFRFPRSKNPFF
jgi:aconitate hydratase